MARVGPNKADDGRPLNQAVAPKTRFTRLLGTTAEQNLILPVANKIPHLLGFVVGNGAIGANTLTFKYGTNATSGSSTLLIVNQVGGTMAGGFNAFPSAIGGGLGLTLPSGQGLSFTASAGTPDVLVEYLYDNETAF